MKKCVLCHNPFLSSCLMSNNAIFMTLKKKTEVHEILVYLLRYMWKKEEHRYRLPKYKFNNN